MCEAYQVGGALGSSPGVPALTLVVHQDFKRGLDMISQVRKIPTGIPDTYQIFANAGVGATSVDECDFRPHKDALTGRP